LQLQDDEEDVYLYAIETDEAPSQALVDVKIQSENCSRDLTCKIDTGAEANVMPISTLETILPDARHQIKPTQVRIVAYGNNTISQLGVTSLRVTSAHAVKDCEFFITETSGPIILGLETCTDLKLVTINNEVKKRPLGDTKLRQKILHEYADVFQGIGCFEQECKIILDPNVPPVVHAPRRVPVALRDALKEELDKLVGQDILSPVTYPTDWVNSCVCVSKSNGKIRLCLDPKDLNNAIKRPHYVTPTLEDILPRLNQAQFFSILDARSGYWNIKLDSASADLTTFNTAFGRYRFNRLPMGIKCAQDEFQRMIDMTFGNIPNTVGIADDLVVYGRTEDEHDKALHAVLQRAREAGPKFNEEKMILKCSEIPFFGHLIGSNGVRPDPGKVAAIQAMQPDSVQSLQTFLGMVNYLHRYSPRIADVTAPLRDLCRNDVEFVLGPEHEQAINRTKQEIANAKHLPYYDPNKELILQVDASLRGLGAALIQDKGPIAFASKSLTETESRYSNIEREMLGIVWGLEKFHHYVFGRKVQVQTDHKPLASISRKNLSNTPPRLARMLIRTQRYDIDVSYVPGKEIPLADALSRITPLDKTEVRGLDRTVHELQSINASPTRLAVIREQINQDPEMSMLRETIMEGWPETRSDCPSALHPYWNFRDELAVENGILLKGPRLIVPKQSQADVLKQIHCGHLGVEKCRLRARVSVYWNGMNSDIEDLVSKCGVCQKYQASQPKEKLIPQDVPPSAWHTVATDLFTWQQDTYLVLADVYSRFPIVRRLTSLSSQSIIYHLKTIFDEHGIPEVIRSDNGPQYSSSEFRRFAEEYGFRHITSSPHFPQSNGFIERMIRTVKQIFNKAHDSKSDLHLAMMTYRATPSDHHTPSPAELLFGRKIRTTLVQKCRIKSPDIRDSMINRKEEMMKSSSTRSLPPLAPDQHVRVQDPRTKHWTPAVIKSSSSEPRSYIVNTPTGTLRRNRAHIRQTGEKFEPFRRESSPAPAPEPRMDEHQPISSSPATPAAAEPLRRSTRSIKPPDKLNLSIQLVK
jgi:transposase InsO family protein